MNASVLAFLIAVGTLALPPAAAHADEAPRAPGAAIDAPTRHVQVGGERIAYRRIGSGPPLLLANRLRGTLDTWDPLFLDALARDRSVIVFDYPGIGYSEGVLPDDMARLSAFIDALADALELERFAILGWSWGGLVAQSYLLDHPQRVSHAILLATSPPGPNAIPLQPAFLERAVKPVNDLADEEVLFFEPASARSLQAARASRERIHARAGVDARIPSRMEQFQPYFTAAEGFHADAPQRRGRLMRSPLPILVLAGDHDISTAGQNWFPLIGHMRNAQFVFHSETGHAPQHQYPAWSAATIATFLEQAPR